MPDRPPALAVWTCFVKRKFMNKSLDKAAA